MSVFRHLEKWLVMIHVQKNMQRFITIGLMFRKHFMLTQLAFLISGLLAGEFAFDVTSLSYKSDYLLYKLKIG
jgi:hypothetical protein